jgi:DNA primase
MIQQRGISAEMVQAFGLGMAPDSWDALAGLVARRGLPESAFVAAGLLKHRTNGAGLYDSFRNRLIFPICDELGQPIAFGARKLSPDDEPKYLNSAESSVFSKSRTLFGLHLAKRAIMDSRQVIVTEGYTDVIACHQAGITNVVGTLGTALTREHAKVLSRLCDTVVMLFDGDDAGQKAADRAISVFFSEPVDVRICVLPDNLDPDELLKQDDGAERFVAATANSIDALAFKFRRFQQKIAPSTGISARQKLLESFLAELGELGFAAMQGVRKRLVLAQLSDLIGVPVADLERATPRPRQSQIQPADAHSELQRLRAASDSFRGSLEVSRARRMAERELLAVLIYEPHAGLTPEQTNADTGEFQAAALSLDDFHDEQTRSIAEVILPALHEGRVSTVQQLLGALENEACRRLVSELYFDGQARCGESSADALEAYAQSRRALHSCTARDLLNSASPEEPDASEPAPALSDLQSFLIRRRKVHHNPAAIAHGVRS